MLQKEAQISHDALWHNFNFFKKSLGNKSIVACVKANAYGHGFYEVMPVLANVDACYVHSWDAAIRLRRDYPNLRVVLAGFIGNEITIKHLISENIDWVIFCENQLELLKSVSYDGSSINVWLKLDTGMNRLGFTEDAAHKALYQLEQSPFVRNIILMTHFACGANPAHEVSKKQMAAFDKFTNLYPYFETSVGATALALSKELPLGDWVRIGGGMYGLSPFPEQTGQELGLQPVMRLHAKVISVKSCSAGEFVGYDATWQVKSATRIAVIAIGYGDGYLRSITSGNPVYINGGFAKVVGRISMDTVVVELPDDLLVTVGDWAELWGANMPIEHVAKSAGTISYELATTVGRRVKRTIVRSIN